jgi:GxxExxY protein
MDKGQVSHVVVGAAIEVHRTLGGPGLLESVYEEALAWELAQRGMVVERQKPVQVAYGDQLRRAAGQRWRPPCGQ